MQASALSRGTIAVCICSDATTDKNRFATNEDRCAMQMSARRVGRLLGSKFQALFFSFTGKISPKREIEKPNTVVPANWASSTLIILFSEMLKFSKHFFLFRRKNKI
jgi:hypothetical protein